MAQDDKPEVIALSNDEIESLKQRVEMSSLDKQDQKILLALLSFNFWLQNQLSRAQLSLLRLKRIFGLPTEKKSLQKVKRLKKK